MLICSKHFLNRCANIEYNFRAGGYLVVEFFFIMSGFFMMKKYYSVSRAHGYENGSLPAEKAAEESLAFLKGKLYHLYPAYLWAFLTMLIWEMYVNQDIVHTAADAFWEAFLLQRIGISSDPMNGPAWYLCVMLVAGYFVYFFIMKNHKVFTHIFAPAAIMMIYCYMNKRFGHLGPIATVVGCVPAGMLRGAADMMLGCLAYEAYRKLEPYCKNKFALLGTGLELMLYGLIFYYMLFTRGKDERVFICVTLMAAAIVLSYMGNSYLSRLLNHRFFGILGGLSYIVYLNHWLLIKIFRHFDVLSSLPWETQYILFISIVLVYSLVIMVCGKRLRVYFKNKSLPKAEVG